MMIPDDTKSVGLRANEWNILLFYTKAWIQHVQTMADREDDAFVDMLNDSLRLQDICGKIEDRLA